MRPLKVLLVTAVLALFGACPSLATALGDALGLVFGGAAQIVTQPALLLAVALGGLVAVVARRGRRAI
jgi:hypothetical protein